MRTICTVTLTNVKPFFEKVYGFFGFKRQDIKMLVSFTTIMLRERFMRSSLGLVWAVANPILMLGIFTFVCGFVFKAKLPGAETSLSYVIWLISGYGPWLAFSEGLSNSTSSVVSNKNLVKNLQFKTELLPMAGGLTGLVPLLVSLIYLTLLLAVDNRTPSIAWLIMLPYLIMQFAFVIGIGLFLATVNVFVRDVSMALPNILIIMLFASPIFYPIEAFPSIAQAFTMFNPLYLLAEGYRQPLLYGSIPPLGSFLYLAAFTTITFLFGLFVFRRLKNYFDSRI